jgi:hypothetical protein
MKLIAGALVTAVLLAGCSSQSSMSAQSGTEGSGSTEIVFLTSPKKPVNSYLPKNTLIWCVSGGSGDGVTSCEFDYSVKNISKLPQTIMDYPMFAMSNEGLVYKATHVQEILSEINPGEEFTRSTGFELPIGVTITTIFKAESATDMHIYDVTFNSRTYAN